jgi:hypothetical protein
MPKAPVLTAEERKEIRATHRVIESNRSSADKQATARGIRPDSVRDVRRAT